MDRILVVALTECERRSVSKVQNKEKDTSAQGHFYMRTFYTALMSTVSINILTYLPALRIDFYACMHTF